MMINCDSCSYLHYCIWIAFVMFTICRGLNSFVISWVVFIIVYYFNSQLITLPFMFTSIFFIHNFDFDVTIILVAICTLFVVYLVGGSWFIVYYRLILLILIISHSLHSAKYGGKFCIELEATPCLSLRFILLIYFTLSFIFIFFSDSFSQTAIKESCRSIIFLHSNLRSYNFCIWGRNYMVWQHSTQEGLDQRARFVVLWCLWWFYLGGGAT